MAKIDNLTANLLSQVRSKMNLLSSVTLNVIANTINDTMRKYYDGYVKCTVSIEPGDVFLSNLENGSANSGQPYIMNSDGLSYDASNTAVCIENFNIKVETWTNAVFVVKYPETIKRALEEYFSNNSALQEFKYINPLNSDTLTLKPSVIINNINVAVHSIFLNTTSVFRTGRLFFKAGAQSSVRTGNFRPSNWVVENILENVVERVLSPELGSTVEDYLNWEHSRERYSAYENISSGGGVAVDVGDMNAYTTLVETKREAKYKVLATIRPHGAVLITAAKAVAVSVDSDWHDATVPILKDPDRKFEATNGLRLPEIIFDVTLREDAPSLVQQDAKRVAWVVYRTIFWYCLAHTIGFPFDYIVTIRNSKSTGDQISVVDSYKPAF